MKTAVYASPIGEMLLAADGEALCGAWFEGQKYYASSLNAEKEREGEAETLRLAQQWLDGYFSGDFSRKCPQLAPHGTAFQKTVWTALLTVPCGQRVSYKQLAEKISCRSARAVGSAVGRNPISVFIPCHRVIGAGGALTGYAGGLERKSFLLSLEEKYIG